MTEEPDRIRGDLPANADPAEAELMIETGLRLSASRPLPAPAFRGELRRRLAGTRAGATMAPQRALTLAASCSLAGLLLLVVAAAGVAGSGPFAA